MTQDVKNLARQALVEVGRLHSIRMGFSGLASESNELCMRLSIPTTMCHYQCVSLQDIKEAVQRKVFFENRQRMLESRNPGDPGTSPGVLWSWVQKERA